MDQEKLPLAQLAAKLASIDGLIEQIAITVSKALATDCEPEGLVTDDIIVIVQLIHLANCDPCEDTEEINSLYEKNLTARFRTLISIHKAMALLPATSERLLRELAVTARQTLEIHSLGRRQEYVNNFIANLTIAADKLATPK